MNPRIISYTRFSSKRQAHGKSEERQGDAAQKWCRENGFELDENISDLGVSAFRGKHRNSGALSAFLKRIDDGKIPPGSYLLIEHFDRLTREEVSDAQDLVKLILKKGVNIVTLLDGRVYTRESLNHLESLLVMILMFSRSHEESRAKGDRVAETFQRRRAEGTRVFGAAPGWLRRKDGSDAREWEVIPELAAIVVRVFELAAKGIGGPSIARLANREKWAIPTRRTAASTQHWHSKLPQILLRNRAVLGETEHMLMNRKALEAAGSTGAISTGQVITDYYPRIVSDRLWHRAQGAIASRKTVPPKRDQNYFNIYAGLLKCGYCGASMQRKVEPRGRSRAQLVCTSKLAGISSCRTASAGKTDGPVLSEICAAGGADLGLGYEKQAVQEDIVVATSQLEDISSKMRNLSTAIQAVGPVSELLLSLGELKSKRDSIEKLIEERSQQLALEPNSAFDTSYAESVIAVLYEKSEAAMQLRADCNARLRRAINSIQLWAYDVAIAEFKNGIRVLVYLQPKVFGDSQPKWAEQHKMSKDFMNEFHQAGLLPVSKTP